LLNFSLLSLLCGIRLAIDPTSGDWPAIPRVSWEGKLQEQFSVVASSSVRVISAFSRALHALANVLDVLAHAFHRVAGREVRASPHSAQQHNQPEASFSIPCHKNLLCRSLNWAFAPLQSPFNITI
jgi:hypothetical protein